MAAFIDSGKNRCDDRFERALDLKMRKVSLNEVTQNSGGYNLWQEI
jgi:hypothetical protein